MLNPLGDALGDMLRDHELQEPLKPHTARIIWPEIVGPEIAAATFAEAVRGGVLFVRVRSAAWANELTFYKKDILDRLNARVGAKVISDIHFKTSGRAFNAPRKPSPAPEPDDATIDQTEPAGPLVDLARRGGLADPEADSRFRSILNRVAKTQTWKRQMGWIACSRCGALFPPQNSSSGLCPFCATIPRARQARR